MNANIEKFKDWLNATPTDYPIDAEYYATNKDYVRDCLSPKDAFFNICGDGAFWDLVAASNLEGESNGISRDILEAEEIIHAAYDAA